MKMGFKVGSVSSLFLLFFQVCVGLIDIGKYLKTCDRNSPDVNDCLVDAIRDGIDTMAGGIQEWQVPAVDPYHQKELRIEYNRNQIWVRMVMKDIYVEGLKDSTVKDARLKADEDSFHLEVDMQTPVVYVNGTYRGEGRYNALHILAEGEFNATMTDLVYTWKLDGKPEEKNNETYLRITSFYMRPDVGDMKSHITNENPDSKSLTELGNRFANDNWRPLYRELLPYAQSNWNKIGSRVANKLFLKLPYNQIFPISN